MITFSEKTDNQNHWRWRYRYALRLAEQLDLERYQVWGIYLIGSTKNACAGPRSDIDLIIHDAGEGSCREALKQWLEGWSCCLSEINFQLTQERTTGLLDVHFITDQDIREKNSFAVMIGSLENSARPLNVREPEIPS